MTEQGVRLSTILKSDQPGMLRVVAIAQRAGTTGSDSPVYAATNRGLYRWTETNGLEELDTVARDAVFFDAEGHRWELFQDGQFVRDGELNLCWPEPLGELQSIQHLVDGQTLLAFTETLVVHRPGDGQLRRVRTSGSPRALLEGREGGLWVASEPIGLEFFERQEFDLLKSGVPPVHSDILASLGSDMILMASRSLSMPRLVAAMPTPTERAEPTSIQFAGDMKGVYGATTGYDGIHYLATGGGVATVEDLGSGRARMAAFDGIASNNIVAGPGDSVWVSLGDGLHELRDGVATGRHFKQYGGGFTALTTFADSIVAARFSRIVRFYPATGEAILLADLSGAALRNLYPDRHGHLWITTYGSGLYRLRGDEDALGGPMDHWGLQNGLPDRYLAWIGAVPGPTAETHLWVNSNRGVFAISRESLEATREDPYGLVECWLKGTPESNGTSGLALSSGQLVVATLSGFCAIDTNEPLRHGPTPYLSLSALWANGREADLSTRPSGATDLTFEFEAASYPRGRGGVVEYRLEGHDGPWRPAGNERAARYSNLPPGEYTFQVRARATGALTGSLIVATPVVISPVWHQRLGLQPLLLALLLGGGLLIVRQLLVGANSRSQALQLQVEAQQRIASLRRQLSDAEENERARIARELHDDLAQRLAAVALMVELIDDGSGRTRDPVKSARALQSIRSSVRDLAHDVHWLSRRLHPTVLDDLGLEAALRSECARRAERAPFSIKFQHDSSAKELKGEVGLAMFRIVQEGLQNVATHANASEAIVRLHTVKDQLVLQIEDDGRGFTTEDRSGPGIGLASMSERAQLVNGTFEIRRREAGGTIVQCTVPVAARG